MREGRSGEAGIIIKISAGNLSQIIVEIIYIKTGGIGSFYVVFPIVMFDSFLNNGVCFEE